jgi:hypothetical protein
MRLIFRLSLFLFLPFCLGAQTDSVAFGPGFQFRQGLYLNFQQFRLNRPVPRNRIVSNYDTTRLDFIRQVVSAKLVKYLDESGALVEISPAKLWGFCENNSVYIRYNTDFNKVIVIGSICHFTSLYTTYMTTGPTNAASSTYGTPVENTRQYIIDMKTGEVLEYTLGNLEGVFKRDAALYSEFSALRKGKRRKLMFYYLRKYNERNPLYFKS